MGIELWTIRERYTESLEKELNKMKELVDE